MNIGKAEAYQVEDILDEHNGWVKCVFLYLSSGKLLLTWPPNVYAILHSRV